LEQFRRIANAYFLIMAILQVIPEISPGLNNPAASFLPLVVVLTVTAVKEAIEDYVCCKILLQFSSIFREDTDKM
jgi:hypothetical protein